MKRSMLVASAVAMLLGVGIAGAEETPAGGKAADTPAVKKQTVCPIQGGAINTNLYADYSGKRVYFCCQGCPEEFKKDPAKYIGKLEKAGVTLDKAPAKDAAKKQATPPEAESSKESGHAGHKGGGCM